MFNSKVTALRRQSIRIARVSHNADEISEHRKPERTFSELADNAAWMKENPERRIHPVIQDR